MRIDVLKGPVNRELLGAIALLYGSHDKKYSSVDFCDVVFNQNPAGHSFHAFAYDDDRAVGHYAVIPVGIVAKGKAELSGKGEALFLEEKYRSEFVQDGNAEIPVGIALAVYLYRFVLEHGIRVIHVIADDTIGVIHRMAGCRKETIEQKRSVLLLSTGKLTSPGERLTRCLALRIVLLAQRVLLGLLGFACLFSRKPVISETTQINSSDPIVGLMVASQYDLAAVDKWTIARDPAHLLWFFKTGLLGVYTIGDSRDEYVVVRKSVEPGGDIEIVDCNLAGNRMLPAIRLVSHIVGEARKAKASRVTFSSWLPRRGTKMLGVVSTLFGFVTKVERTSLYLKSDDPFFLNTQNIALTPFFYGTF